MRTLILSTALLSAICQPVAAQDSDIFLLLAGPIASGQNSTPVTNDLSYPVVDTNQSLCYEKVDDIICPASGANFYGQDAQYSDNPPSYTNNNNGTITDNITGLTWQQAAGDKKTQSEALAELASGSFSFADHTDWRLPTIKELYSLILFNGTDASGYEGTDTSSLIPFIDTTYLDFVYGDTTGERIIDSQYLSSTEVKDGTNNGAASVFGVNFADGRIKGYELQIGPVEKDFFVLYVRDNTSQDYGTNSFMDNGDSTVIDKATGLQWMKADSVTGMNWQAALAYCENLTLAEHTDWRLPDAKELQSIVDYSRAPESDSTAAIDPVFNSTSITNEANQMDWPYYWTGTTNGAWNGKGGWGIYISFGRAMGNMNGWVDVHGAGAQRSDPKYNDGTDYSEGHGPQGDAIRIDNYVRCVRNAD